jgi:NADH-quinone oxidoreductase subunit F
VPWIVNNSGDDYAKIGIGRSTGTKLTASGHVKNPGVYEIELGLSVYEFMNSDEYLGGMSSDRPLKALVPGGSSVPILPADLIYKTANGEDRLMTYELSDGGFATGSMLGSGGFIVYNDTSCIVRNTWNFARFIITKAVDPHVVKVQDG